MSSELFSAQSSGLKSVQIKEDESIPCLHMFQPGSTDAPQTRFLYVCRLPNYWPDNEWCNSLLSCVTNSSAAGRSVQPAASTRAAAEHVRVCAATPTGTIRSRPVRPQPLAPPTHRRVRAFKLNPRISDSWQVFIGRASPVSMICAQLFSLF